MAGPEEFRRERIERARRFLAGAPEEKPKPPPIAAKADDLEAIKKAVEDAAAVSGGLWLSYLFVLFYIAVAAGAVTHVDLLLENPVKLPFLLNIELPLKAFFFLAPILFLVTHAYTLAHFRLLADKAGRFHVELHEQIKDGLKDAHEIRTGLRRQLPSNIFVQFLAGPEDLRESLFGRLLKLIAWTTLVIGPVLLFLLLQLQFLPYHDSGITWLHREALLLDLVLIWWLWRKILAGRGDFRRWRTSLGIVASLAAFTFSWTVATFPGEWRERPLSWVASIEPASANAWLFAGEVNDITRRRESWLSNTLVLPGFNIYEALKIDDPKKLEWRDHTFDLRGRHLEGAVFSGANLTKVDLTGAHLERASLDEAQLQGASLDKAQLQGASAYRARFQGASLYRTQLKSVSFNEAHLQGASLAEAQLQYASLANAQLQGASLVGASLPHAFLDGAQLQGSSLYGGELQGASLDKAQLQGVTLELAHLQGASLDEAQLQGASLVRAELQGAVLAGAGLQGADLDNAKLQGATLIDAKLQGASLFGAQLQGAWLSWADLQGASLSSARLQGASLEYAKLTKADLTGANLSRAVLQGTSIESVFSADLKGLLETMVSPTDAPWTNEYYDYLRPIIQSDVPEGNRRKAALERIEILDCKKTKWVESAIELASCDPKAKQPAWIGKMREKIKTASVKEGPYRQALADFLDDLVCNGDENAAYVVRGLLRNGRIKAIGAKFPALVDSIIKGKDCPVSAALTEDDRARLRAVVKEAAPAPAPAGKK